MKKLYLIFLLISYFVYAQNESQSQSIELPDFVITGKESINIPKIQKSVADFIPLLSNDFFTPDFPDEEKTEIKLPEVETEVLGYSTNTQINNALLIFNGGLETWPNGEFYFNDWSGNFLYDLNIRGKNELEFVDNAGVTSTGGSIGGKYFIDHNSNVFPGLKFEFNADYNYENYNFYGYSTNPGLERTVDDGLIDFSINYVTDPYNNFGIRLTDLYYNQRDNETDENIVGTSAYYKLKYDKFDLKIEGSYKNQSVSSPSISKGNQYYFSTSASMGLLLYDILNLKAGVYLAEMEGNTFFSPTLFGSVKLNKYLSFFGSFSPNTEFVTLRDFQLNNRYFQPNGIVNTFVENKSHLKFAFKYEFEKYFEISGGTGYLNSDNNFYFEDNIEDGFFNINITDTENYFAFINFLFRKGPFGQFYGDIKYQEVTTQNNKELPYSPTISGKLNYRYDMATGFGIKLTLFYFGETFTSLSNENRLSERIDLGAAFYYSLFNNFNVTLEFQNLLDNDYFYFKNYRAKPFDVLAGFEFRW